MSIKLAALLVIAAVGCGSDNKQTPNDAPRAIDAPVVHDGPVTDAGVTDGTPTDGTVAPDASCFTNPDPNSHYQIINACTTALKVYTTHPKPPLLNADGSLPPLP